MILPIYLYNHPVLRQKAQPIDAIDEQLHQLLCDMMETMYNANGIGLAANQVGKRQAIVVVDISQLEEGNGTEPMHLLNPRIIHSSDRFVEYEEGCLSVPGVREIVDRPDIVTVEYRDIDMRMHVIESDGLLARVLQHEIDHLNGIYFFDRISAARRVLIKGKLKRIERGQVQCDYPFVHPALRKV